MITKDGWVDWAQRLPGPTAHTNVGVNSVKGVFLHSAEGYAGTLFDPNSPYGYNGKNSWHGTNLFDGSLIQHYPLTARCWHATAANQEYVGFENEGYHPNEPTLTDAQVNTCIRLIKDIAAWSGWSPRRPASPLDISMTLWEHNEVVRIGGSSTTCPDGRIPWDKILAGLNPQPQIGEDIMKVVYGNTDRFNGWKNNNQPVEITGRKTVLNVLIDLGLISVPKLARIEIFKDSPGGYLGVGHGDFSYAGCVTTDERHSVIDVVPAKNGDIILDATWSGGSPVKIWEIRLIGIWE